ncbi:MAG TPA: DUF58 domain-containing protein [Verrucomicrobiae bacterium]|nr:DUF58 domain-containing protein [Verrucomicrobiae bacterium]
MIFTVRFFYLLGLGLLPILLSGFVPHLTVVALVYDAVLLTVAAYDFLVTIPRHGVEIARACEHILSIGVHQTVVLRLRNLSARAVRVAVKDAPPITFARDGHVVSATLAPAAQAQYSYTVRPTARGVFSFGNIFCRIDGRLGLTRAQITVPAPLEVKVYPNVKQLSQVELALAHASMLQYGLKPAHLLGEGTEFESLRDYVPDDDYRWIDWKATARRNRLTSREYETERNQRLIIAIDTGRLLGAKVGDFTKLDYAANAAALLAQVGLSKGDLVGLLLFANRIIAYLPPDKGREHLSRIVDFLHRAQSARVESDYALAFAHLARKNARRSLMICFTDLVDSEASKALIASMRHLAPRHLPVCVTISDSDLMAAQTVTPETAPAAFELVAAMELWEDYQKAVRFLERQGALTVNVPANTLTTAVINRYLEVKRRGLL